MLCIETSLSVNVRSKSSLQCLYCKLSVDLYLLDNCDLLPVLTWLLENWSWDLSDKPTLGEWNIWNFLTSLMTSFDHGSHFINMHQVTSDSQPHCPKLCVLTPSQWNWSYFWTATQIVWTITYSHRPHFTGTKCSGFFLFIYLFIYFFALGCS